MLTWKSFLYIYVGVWAILENKKNELTIRPENGQNKDLLKYITPQLSWPEELPFCHAVEK